MEGIDIGRVREIQHALAENGEEKRRLLDELYTIFGVRDEKKSPRKVDKRRSRSALMALLHKPLV